MDNLDTPQYSPAQIAAAAGVDKGTLYSWLQRGHWRLDGADAAAPTHGAGHKLTLRRALQIGIAVELMRHDVKPARAFRAALSFSDVSGAPILASDLPREPGRLYGKGQRTWLLLPAGQDWGEILPVKVTIEAWRVRGKLAIDINEVVDRVKAGLEGAGDGAV